MVQIFDLTLISNSSVTPKSKLCEILSDLMIRRMLFISQVTKVMLNCKLL